MDIFLFIVLILFCFYVLGLLILSSGLNRLQKKVPDSENPFVSVVVSAHNEEDKIWNCMEHLAKQDYPSTSIEFIIVDDRSSDATPDLIKKFIVRDSRFLTISIKDRIPEFAPKKRAIDAAIKSSKGSVILHTDADGRPGPNWVKHMAAYFDENVDMVIGYAPYHLKKKTVSEKLLALEYFSHAAIAAATSGLEYPATCVGTNLAYRKQLYIDMDGFGKFKPFISGDDDLFLNRVRGTGKHKIAYAISSETQVYNNPPDSFNKFFHQRMRYASKGFYYQPVISISLTTYYLLNVLLFCAIFVIPSALSSGILLSIILALKIFVEYLFLRKAGKILGDRRSLSVIVPASLLHIPYVVLFGLLGQFKYFKWAEDHSEKAVQQYANS